MTVERGADWRISDIAATAELLSATGRSRPVRDLSDQVRPRVVHIGDGRHAQSY
jgi:hypothetical protein